MNKAIIILSVLTVLSSIPETRTDASEDWLIDPSGYVAKIQKTDDGKSIQMRNGLISRTIRLTPNAATTSFLNITSGEEFVRSVRPEAEVQIDSMTFAIGGLTCQPVHNYLLPEWIDEMQSDPNSFQFVDFEIVPTLARFPWKKRRQWMPEDRPWPPPGKSLVLIFKLGQAPQGREYLRDITVRVHYEIYDGIPLISKWISIVNESNRTIMVDSFKSEILAVVEAESSVGVKKQWRYPNMTVETDYAFGGGMSSESCWDKSVFWETDPLYLTQVNYERKTPCLLVCKPQYGPAQEVKGGETFESFRAFELLHDNWDRERKGLAQRKMYRTIAPWVTENPILMHVRRADDKSVRLAIDQCADVGFELVIMTFGSGFNLEDESEANLRRMKALADYAHSRGIALGGYSLLASRKVGGGNDVVMPEGMKPRFGHSPCLQSQWGRDYFRKLYQFFQQTGMDVLEHDGSYPGDVCASTEHPGHRGLADSQWKQFMEIRDFYRWCRGKGIYLNVPDWYFLNGSNKTGMGYRETNWSLPRKQQEIIERQNIFDGTWEKTPSMGWMFVPLTQYHGGGAAATIEPLREHLPHYEQRLMNLFGAGVQACYRGPRLYDAPETRAVVKKWVDFYKKHRAILDSDIIHVRRPDGRKPDCILHVTAKLKTKGLALIYNPTDEMIAETIKLSLYYTGLTKTATISERDGLKKIYKLKRNFFVELPVKLAAHGMTWFIITDTKRVGE